MRLMLGAEPHRKKFDFSLAETESIGILLSGGLDSTALLILILEELKETKPIGPISIAVFTQTKSTMEPSYAARILNQFKVKYPNIEFLHHNNIPNSQITNQLGRMDISIVRKVFKYFGYNSVYAAFTNETPTDQKTFEGSLGFRYGEFPDIITPFINLTKHQILEIYDIFNHRDLIEFTHSCSQQAYDNCYRCYSCNERAWAFTKLGLSDPGLIKI